MSLFSDLMIRITPRPVGDLILHLLSVNRRSYFHTLCMGWWVHVCILEWCHRCECVNFTRIDLHEILFSQLIGILVRNNHHFKAIGLDTSSFSKRLIECWPRGDHIFSADQTVVRISGSNMCSSPPHDQYFILRPPYEHLLGSILGLIRV